MFCWLGDGARGAFHVGSGGLRSIFRSKWNGPTGTFSLGDIHELPGTLAFNRRRLFVSVEQARKYLVKLPLSAFGQFGFERRATRDRQLAVGVVFPFVAAVMGMVKDPITRRNVQGKISFAFWRITI